MASKIIENDRLKLADELLKVMPRFTRVSIATGYWDLPGFQMLEEALSTYENVRLLIGQEPLPPAYAKRLDVHDLDSTFPESHIVRELSTGKNTAELRASANAIKEWMAVGRLQVKVMRGRFLHAKAYIFGDYDSAEAIGVIGSSNFTAAGLTKNLELNSLDDNAHSIIFKPSNLEQPHGHLSWFDALWDSGDAEDWNGKFTEIIDASPLGELMFSEYHMYVKALYEIYGDELVDEIDTNQEIEKVLYAFQARNAKLLLKKLDQNGVAILADSVGLGKTITAGAVVKKYLDDYGANRVYIIAPAALVSQWKSELAESFGLVSGFEVISLQDARKIAEARELDKYAPVDLFVLDEAHNLRSGHGSRFDDLLDWFSDNPDSHVLMLTATPINNSLKDLKNQIQLGAKGSLSSFPVVYPSTKGVDVIDFYDAIERLNTEIKRAVKRNEVPDYGKVNDVMRQGLRHFMVRTTRHGIEKEFGGVHTPDGKVLKFPKSNNQPRGYSFDHESLEQLREIVIANSTNFDGIDVHDVSVRWLLGLTERAEHPLDTLAKNKKYDRALPAAPFEAVFQLLLILGFAPYKSEIYRKKYHGKELSEIAGLVSGARERAKVASQLSIHNMLRVTLLKRLESSQYALSESLTKYRKRLIQFETILESGRVPRVKDMSSIIDQFDDDDAALANVDWDEMPDFETEAADPRVFNIPALKNDLARDHKILNVLEQLCAVLATDDDKLNSLAALLERLDSDETAGNKVLVFSYFADTIEYLKTNLSQHVSIDGFAERSSFVSGSSRARVNDLAKRFSPKSKKATPELLAEGEIDYLFATDVLSEGQNLQDCAVIVNYDLHWNPVRMIQRNGRINRLGSEFDAVNIFNMHPDEKLEDYLTLVKRLQTKIDQIKFSIGTDQSVLGEEANPLEFVDIYNSEKANEAIDALDDDGQLLTEDEFVNDLRVFDRDASVEEKRLVIGIGVGKWGTLPSKTPQVLPDAHSLSLVEIFAGESGSGNRAKSHMFVRKSDRGHGPVEVFKALSAIKVKPTSEGREFRVFDLDRDDISSKSILVARANMRKASGYFKITRTVHLALDGVKKQRPDLNFADALSKVVTRQQHRRAMRLVRLSNADLAKSGEVAEPTISEVEKFVTSISAPKVLSPESEKVEFTAVIHFAR